MRVRRGLSGLGLGFGQGGQGSVGLGGVLAGDGVQAGADGGSVPRPVPSVDGPTLEPIADRVRGLGMGG